MTNVFSHNCDIHVLYINTRKAIFNFDDSWNHFIDVIYVPIALLYGYVQIPKPKVGYDRSTLSMWWLISNVRFKAAHTFLITFKSGDSGGVSTS